MYFLSFSIMVYIDIILSLGSTGHWNNQKQPPEVVCEKKHLQKFHKIHYSTCARVSFLIKLQSTACNFIKKDTLAQVLSCEFCKNFKNSFFYRATAVAASE